MGFSLVLFILAMNIANTQCVDLGSIYEETLDVLGENKESLEHVLKKYYLTDNKEESLWWLAYKNSLETFNIELGYEDLLPMEATIKKCTAHFYTCAKVEVNKRKSQCLNRFTDFLKGGERVFLWNISPDISGEGKAKIGSQYTAFAVFSSTIAALATENLYLLNDWVKSNNVIDEFISFLQNFICKLFMYENDVTKWRSDQVSAVNICEINQHFWKEFEGTCETRWKREDFESETANDTFRVMFDYNENDDVRLNVADRIGRDDSLFTKTYRGQVVDDVTKRTIFSKEITVGRGENRGAKLMELHKEGMKRRWILEKKLKKKMKKYHANTIKKARKILSKALQVLEDSKVSESSHSHMIS